MVKKLTKHGNSLALVIDKPILELLGIEADTPVKLTTNGKKLIIEKLGDQERAEKFGKALGETHRQYGRMLKRLSEK